jgi:hypothetical protein
VLDIRKHSKMLVISIIDNGVGMHTTRSSGSMKMRQPRGTRLVTSWVENLNKLLPADSVTIQTTDLYDEHGGPNGTCVGIILNTEALEQLHHEK